LLRTQIFIRQSRMASATIPRFAVCLRSNIENDALRIYFRSNGYSILDETMLPDPHSVFTHSICRGKIGERYLHTSIDKADFIIFNPGDSLTDVLGFVTINFDAEKKNIYIAVICSSEGARGVGTALLTAVEDIAPVLGADHITLDAISDESLTDFYKRRGYKFSSAKRRAKLFPMEKNLTGTRKYNESLTYKKIMGLENEMINNASREEKTMKYGIFVRYSTNTGNLLRSFSSIESFINVSYDSDYAAIYGKTAASQDIHKIIKANAMEKKYNLSNPEQLQKKIQKERPDFIFYNYESDPGNPESFIFLERKEGVFVVSVMYIQRHVNEFLRTLMATIHKLVRSSEIIFESTAIFASLDTFESNESILEALREDHYKVKNIVPVKPVPVNTYVNTLTGKPYLIGGTRRHRSLRRRGRRYTRRG
jgi:hypothetical protein